MPKSLKERNYIGTVYNWNEDETKTLFRDDSNANEDGAKLKYAVWQVERCPDTGRLHIQCYVEFTQPVRVAWVQQRLRIPGAHLEKRMGNRDQAISYCSKESTRVEGPYYFGGRMERTTKSDGKWTDAATKLRAGGNVRDIERTDPGFTANNLRKLQQYESYCLQAVCNRERNVHALWIHGPSGIGKTTMCRRNVGYGVHFCLKPNGEQILWWDGYNGESVLVVDEVRRGGMRVEEYIGICDNFPLRLGIKGGFSHANWSTVLFTSNYSVSAVFSEDIYITRRVVQLYVCCERAVDSLWKCIQELLTTGHTDFQYDYMGRVDFLHTCGKRNRQPQQNLE